jgi:hypothetical protein
MWAPVAGKAAIDCGFYGPKEDADLPLHDMESGISTTSSKSSTDSEDAAKVSAPRKTFDQWKFPLGT